MFTPPPSPRPSIPKQVSSAPEFPSASTRSHAMSSHDQKRRTSRQFRWAVLVVPIVLILITASTRYLTHPAAFDVLSDSQSEWSQLIAQGKHWRLHKRHPFPDPQSALWSGPAMPSASPTPLPTPSTTTVAQPIPSIPSVPPTLPTPFPQAYDPPLTLNFSSISCLSFFTNMTQSPAFRPCRPFSLLSQTSGDFISAQSNLTLMNTLIWGTCNINPGVNQCVANMGWFASALKTACDQDLKDRNVLAVDTLTALNAYKLMYDTACLEDPTSNTYCYIDAVANTNPADLYFYQLPLGTGLPKTIKPLPCSPCLKSVLGQYAEALSNKSQVAGLTGLSTTYEASAQLAVQDCGADYARTGIVNGAVGTKLSVGYGGLLTIMLALWTLIC